MDRALSGDLLSASLSGYNGGLSLISKRVRADAELADSLPESLRITPQKQPPAHGPRTVVRREGRPEPAVLSQPTADVQTRPPLNALCPRACPAQSFLPRACWPGHALPTPHLCACPALSPSCSTVQLESPPLKAHQACGRAAPHASSLQPGHLAPSLATAATATQSATPRVGPVHSHPRKLPAFFLKPNTQFARLTASNDVGTRSTKLPRGLCGTLLPRKEEVLSVRRRGCGRLALAAPPPHARSR